MKKLFTLALVLLVTVAGYSQVKSALNRDAMRKVATMQKVGRMDVMNPNANAQSHSNMVRLDVNREELDYTTYDWQSNDAQRTWTIVWPDGKVNFAYTIATDDSYGDRGTGIATYDANTNEWSYCGARVEKERTGFGSIARYKENSIIVAAHTASEMGLYLIESIHKDLFVLDDILCSGPDGQHQSRPKHDLIQRAVERQQAARPVFQHDQRDR